MALSKLFPYYIQIGYGRHSIDERKKENFSQKEIQNFQLNLLFLKRENKKLYELCVQ